MAIERLHEKFKSLISRKFFVRIHMSAMLTIVILSGVIGSRLLRFAGLRNMTFRYSLMVLISYLVFFLLIRLWLRYIERAVTFATRSGSSGLSNVFDVDLGLGGRTSGALDKARLLGGGGRFGGGGASAGFAEEAQMPIMPPVRAASASGKGFSLPSFGLDDDGLMLLVLFLLLVFAIFGAGFYLVYQAPAILSDAAFQACLGSGFFRTAKNVHEPSWTRSVLKTTMIPFLIVLVLAAAVGFEAHRICPAATSLREAWQCL